MNELNLELKGDQMNRIRTRKIRGFTFIEIIVAIAIISMLTAVSVPVISTVRQKVNEVKAQVDMQNLAAVLNDYWTVNNSYPATLQEITQGVAPYISGKYITGMNGYQYYLLDSNKYTYVLCARPVESGRSGSIEYLLTEAGVLLAKNVSISAWAIVGDKVSTKSSITDSRLQAAITKFDSRFGGAAVPLEDVTPIKR